MRAKQIIVMRRSYPSGVKLRRGKEIAQGAHASQLATQRAAEMDTPAYREWVSGPIAKVCVYVETEEELVAVAQKAHAAGLPYALITDSGRTEFHGVPTKTALGVGPAYADELDPVTGNLPLY
ncbi:MAG: peptidyl-tRNA hydrolase [Candidatus Sericytochromatia bacterium]